jgi:hypothetical protein
MANPIIVCGADPIAVCDANPFIMCGTENIIFFCAETLITVYGANNPITFAARTNRSPCAERISPSPFSTNTLSHCRCEKKRHRLWREPIVVLNFNSLEEYLGSPRKFSPNYSAC